MPAPRAHVDREECQRELQRHCEEVYTDLEEQREVQRKRIEHFGEEGCQQFAVEGRKPEITVDLVLQARARMSDNKVNGPEDAVVSEMTLHNFPGYLAGVPHLWRLGTPESSD